MSVENILNTQKPFLKSSEVAKLFNVDHSTVFLWVKKRKLHPIRTPGGNFRFTRAEVDRLFREVRGKETEHRRSTRYPVYFPVVIQISRGQEVSSFDAFIQDICDRGLGLIIRDKNQSLDDLISGNVHEVLLQNKGVGVLKDTVRCEVRHVHPVNENQVAVGVLVS